MKKLKVVFLVLVVLMSGMIYGNRTVEEKIYSPDHGEYRCRTGEFMLIKFKTEAFSPVYENENWEVIKFFHLIRLVPLKVNDLMVMRVINAKGREIVIKIRAVESDSLEPVDRLILVKKFHRKRRQKYDDSEFSENRFQTEGEVELSGSYEKGKESRFALRGSAVLAGKTPGGMFFQGAGKVDMSGQLKEYGLSLGAGYEPGRLGCFLFLDGLSYQLGEYDRTLHIQVRPAVRFKWERLTASAFLAVPFSKDRYTGVDVTEEGIEYGVFNRAFTHGGVKLDALLFNRLLLSLKTVVASGNIFKIDFKSSLKLFPKVFVNVGCQYSSPGKFRQLSGFDNLCRVSAGVTVGVGNVDKFRDLRRKIIFEPDYPMVSQVKKKKLSEEKEIFKVTLTGQPQAGYSPLPVAFDLVIEGGVPPYQMAWHPEPGKTEFNASTRLNYTYNAPGKYNVMVEVEDSRGQRVSSNTVTIEVLEKDSVKKSFTIRSSSGADGTIDPLGEVAVDEGEDRVFNMKPDAGFVVADVKVDGKSKGALSSYRFENVRADHTIHVEFASAGVKTYTIKATSSSGGSISPSSEVSVVEGRDATFQMTPEYGFKIKRVLVDGKAVTGTPSSYTFESVKEDHEIHVDFEQQQFTIKSSAGENGSIDPLGTRTFNYGENQTYSIKAAAGYMISDVKVDGKSVGAVSEYRFSNISSNHEIQASFTDIPVTLFKITATSSDGGSISPAGTVNVKEGGSAAFSFSPEPGWKVRQVKVDGLVISIRSNLYEFTAVKSDHTIHVDYARITHQVTSSCTDGGAIDPLGTVTVYEGDSQTFEIRPNEGYKISRLLVDNVETAITSTYTFPNVTASHTIRAEFERITHVIEAGAGNGGSIDPVGSIVVFELDDQAFNITANPGYKIKDVKVNGQSIGAVSSYTFEKVKSSGSIQAEFERLQYEIATVAGTHGTISPSGNVKVYWGDDQRFEFTSDTGYRVSDVVVNGSSIGARSSYTFENVKSNQAIEVKFEIITFNIEASSGANGRIRPVGNVEVEYGSSKTFTMTPDDPAVYEIDRVMVDGQNKGALLEYTFSNITADHTIRALWKKKQYKIVSSVGSVGGGTIQPQGIQYYEALETPTYTITPSTGYRIDRVVVDGINKGVISSFTFAPLKADHTISVYFKRITFTVTISKAFTDGTLGSPPNAVTPLGTVTVFYGDDLDITIQNHWSLSTGGEFYSLDYVLDNGSDTVYRGTPKDLVTHTVSDIKENHNIIVYFYHRIES